MSFYVTLISDASSDLFTNKQTDFINMLPETLRLDENYEVALSEIIYSQFIQHLVGAIYVTNDQSSRPEDVFNKAVRGIAFKADESEGKLFVDTPAEQPDPSIENFLYGVLPVYAYENESYSNFIARINDDFDKIKMGSVKFEKQRIKFEIHKNARTIIVGPRLLELLFPGTFKEVTRDFEKSILSLNSFKPQSIYYNTIRLAQCLYVYTDIIEEQFCGNIKSRLLRIVNSPVENVEYVMNTFDAPQYVPVEKTDIKQIRIYIRDHLGMPVRFKNQFSRVIVKLHFRPRRIY